MAKKYILHLLLVLIAFFKLDAHSQAAITEYLHVPGPILFDSANYYLAWSSRPVDNYYKQEYLAKGDSLEHFNRLVLIDVLEDTVKPTDLVYLKVKDLEARKRADAVANYNLIKSPDSSEYIIDFVESEGMPKISFVEWNAYLYKAFKDNNGHKGVMLFGISVRCYDDKVPDFMGNLPALRQSVIEQLIKYQVPPVVID